MKKERYHLWVVESRSLTHDWRPYSKTYWRRKDARRVAKDLRYLHHNDSNFEFRIIRYYRGVV
jgi:hypothetical protein